MHIYIIYNTYNSKFYHIVFFLRGMIGGFNEVAVKLFLIK